MIDFNEYIRRRKGWNKAYHRDHIEQINTLLYKYGLKVDDIVDAPTITTYKVNLKVDSKINSILKLENNFCIATNDQNCRVYQNGNQLCIETKGADNEVCFADLYNEPNFKNAGDKLLMMIGIDTNGKKIFYDLRKAPHMMISGTTGSGKSIFLHQLLLSLLVNHRENIDFIGIDMKGNEFKYYNALKNFIYITDPDRAVNALKYLCEEMDRRYKIFTEAGCRDIDSYNGTMNRKVCVIDEFADLILRNSEVEDYVVRLAQKARACGIHLIIATQSPRRDILTGLIQANIPTRICLSVNDAIESRIAINRKGGEKLNGKGDMLFLPNGYKDPIRVQGANITSQESYMMLVAMWAVQEGRDIRVETGRSAR